MFEYSYRRAVLDDMLVDHEPPVRIVTKLATDGISWKAGEEVEVYDPSTQALDKVNLPDDVDLEIEAFNKRAAMARRVLGRFRQPESRRDRQYAFTGCVGSRRRE